MPHEIKRKLFHCLTLLYALGYHVLGREKILLVLGALLVSEGALEFLRLRLPALNQKLIGLFAGIHREQEVRRFSGVFWTLLGTVIVISVFKDPRVVYSAIGFLTFSDAAAALVGVPFGKTRFFGKSLEGSAACFAASLAVGLVFWEPRTAIFAALLVSAVELLPLPFNDNLWIPVVSGCYLTSS